MNAIEPDDKTTEQSQRQFCRKGMHTCIPAVTLTFDGGTRRLHWCAEHAADADRYREPRVDLAELTKRLGLSEHEQSAVAAWTGDPYGTTWTESEAAELVEVWRQDHERIEEREPELAADTRTLLELVDAVATSAALGVDYSDDDVRVEIARRLALINRYGGTEASNIKAILATGRPLDGWIERIEAACLAAPAPAPVQRWCPYEYVSCERAWEGKTT